MFSVLSKSWVTRSGSTLLLSHGVASWCIVVPTHNRQKVKLEEVVSFSPQMIKSFLPCAGGGGATASGSSPVFSFPSLVDVRHEFSSTPSPPPPLHSPLFRHHMLVICVHLLIKVCYCIMVANAFWFAWLSSDLLHW